MLTAWTDPVAFVRPENGAALFANCWLVLVLVLVVPSPSASAPWFDLPIFWRLLEAEEDEEEEEDEEDEEEEELGGARFMLHACASWFLRDA